MKKTLNEILHDKKYKSVNLKIGSKQGSSFWYCGSGSLLYTIPTIKKVRVSTLAQLHRALSSYEYRRDNLDKIYDETLELAKQREKPIKDFEKYKSNLMRKKENERKRLPKLIKQVQSDIDTHLLDREVQEIIKGISPDEKPCYIIYIKGTEKGSYWTIQEFLKRHKELGQ